MPRQARERSKSGIYHLMLRGINKQNIFEDSEDKEKFIETLGYYKTISNYMLYGYCLMDNHIHLLIMEKEESISQVIKRISSSYVYWYNQKYERCGHLFQERFKSEVVETDQYFLVVMRYIHQNPVKAGIAKDVRKYLWSSYQEYIGTPKVTNTDFALTIFSGDKIRAVELFRTYTDEKNADECLDFKERDKLSDQEVINYLREQGIGNVSELQKTKKEERDNIIRKMKTLQGVTIRQLARITGISKSMIGRT